MEGSLPKKHVVQLVERSLPCGHGEVVSVGAPVFVESVQLYRKQSMVVDMVAVSICNIIKYYLATH